MKKHITVLLSLSLCCFNNQTYADGMDQLQQETNALWSPAHQDPKNNQSEDASQDHSIATSMVAWGLGLAVVIGIIFGLIKSYNYSTTTPPKGSS
jgi:hypothetical protein